MPDDILAVYSFGSLRGKQPEFLARVTQNQAVSVNGLFSISIMPYILSPSDYQKVTVFLKKIKKHSKIFDFGVFFNNYALFCFRIRSDVVIRIPSGAISRLKGNNRIVFLTARSPIVCY